MLFHESEENSEPVMAMPMAITRALPLMGTASALTPGAGERVAVQKSAKLACTASWFTPSAMPKMISNASAMSLVLPSTFWMSLPVRTPWALRAVMPTIRMMASSCTLLNSKLPALNSKFFTLKNGTSTPVNLAKATATAAMTPVWMTKNSVQPYRKAVSRPKASRKYTYCPPTFGNILANSP